MPQQERRLLRRSDVMALLQLEQQKIDWLISTEQLRGIRICDEERFDSRDVFQLIDAYKITQSRKA
jgi:predicted DNA-binding transcriptional regulator AlpA